MEIDKKFISDVLAELGGRDTYTLVASKLYNVDYDKVTPEQRSEAKLKWLKSIHA